MIRLTYDTEFLDFKNYRVGLKNELKEKRMERRITPKIHNSAQKEKSKALGLDEQRKSLTPHGVNLLKVKSDKEPTETKSTLEFLLNTLSRSFNLTVKQAA